MQITALVTVTRDEYSWPTEKVSADVHSPSYTAGDDGLQDWIIASLEKVIRDALDPNEGDRVEISITLSPDRPDLIGVMCLWIV